MCRVMSYKRFIGVAWEIGRFVVELRTESKTDTIQK